MRAVRQNAYGGPDVLELVDLPAPTLARDQVLVRVVAASLNSADVRLMRASPFLARAENGWLRPTKWPLQGSDFAGTVHAVGRDVTRWTVGDEVLGDAFVDGRGAFAELVAVHEDSLAPKPPSTSFDHAAAVPLAGVTALQALRDAAAVQPGHRVLIHGAGGGVGGFAVPIAVHLGAEVHVVAGPHSLARALDAGAVRGFDHTSDDFAQDPLLYDAIVTINGHRSPGTYRRALKPGGRMVYVGGTNRQIFEGLLLAPLLFLGSGRSVQTLTIDDSRRAHDLQELARLLDAGVLRPAIDRTYPLTEVRAAMAYAEQGHVQGKVILHPEKETP